MSNGSSDCVMNTPREDRYDRTCRVNFQVYNVTSRLEIARLLTIQSALRWILSRGTRSYWCDPSMWVLHVKSDMRVIKLQAIGWQEILVHTIEHSKLFEANLAFLPNELNVVFMSPLKVSILNEAIRKAIKSIVKVGWDEKACHFNSKFTKLCLFGVKEGQILTILF